MKKSTLTIIILALVLINVVLTILLTFSLVTTSRKTDSLITKVAALIDLDIASEAGSGNNSTVPAITDLEILDVVVNDTTNKITMTVSDSAGNKHHVVVNATITLNKTSKDYQNMRATVDANMKYIVTTISDTICSYSYENVLSQKTTIAKQVLTKLQDAFKSDIIYDFAFGDYIVQ